MEPRTENGVVLDAEGLCNIRPVASDFQMLTNLGQFTEVQQLDTHPARWCRRIVIRIQIVFNERGFLVGRQLLIDMLLYILKNIVSLSLSSC